MKKNKNFDLDVNLENFLSSRVSKEVVRPREVLRVRAVERVERHRGTRSFT